MPKQFLLNSDGSIPENIDVKVLEAEGIPLVLPTPVPIAAGMIAIEQDPQLDEQGVWRQVWTLVPAEVHITVPTSVTMRQARLALLSVSLLDSVNAAIAAISDPVQRKAAEIEWEYASTVDRNSAFTQQLASGLGLTDEQLDSLFVQAAGL